MTTALTNRVKRIDFYTRRLVKNVFAGAYHSLYKGKGLIFHAVRPYVPGDDIRTIDWRVTARTGDPHVKVFIEERQLTVLLVVDTSASVLFGSSDIRKRDLGAEMAATIAYAASDNQDRVGLLLFSDRIEHFVPPAKGKRHIMRLIRDLLTFEAEGKGSDLALALRSANRLVRQGAIVFLLSDFLVPLEQYRKELALLSRRHDVAAMILSDPLEADIPAVGLMGLHDLETGTVNWVDTSSQTWQKQFKDRYHAQINERESFLDQIGVGRILIPPNGDYAYALIQYFRQELQKRLR